MKIFPQLPGLVHGGDYNPDQWLDRPDILEKDIEYFKEAGINCVTLGVFAWAAEEPTEDDFQLDWLAQIMDRLYQNGIYIILATPTGARPAWLDEKYPEAMRCDERGVRNHHGLRHNHCMSSPAFRDRVRAIDTALAERFADHPGLLMWHISNELGGYCYCEHCKYAWQEWLRGRYHDDIEELNKAWWTGFWSHRFNDFSQIEPPYANGETALLGMNVDWRRFETFLATDFMRFEIDTLHAVKPDVPVTTNFMELFYDYDYNYMKEFVDYISWDNYPEMHQTEVSDSRTMIERSFMHSMSRSMKPDRPFMMMESAPGLVNWKPYNKYRRPGVHELISMQAVADGSDTVQYFQLRKSRGASEQWHGAVIDHIGTDDTRIFKEVAKTGADFAAIAEVTGSVAKNEAAILYDWDNRWALDDAQMLSNETKNFDETCTNIYEEFMRLGVCPNIISSDADWSHYRIICAPMLYLLHDGIGRKIADFVKNGGQFLATYCMGYVDKTTLANLGGFPGQGLSEVFGLKSEEIDTLYPEDNVNLRLSDQPLKPTDAGKPEWSSSAEPISCFDLTKVTGKSVAVHDYEELLRDVTADVLAIYENDYMAGTPAITRNAYGKGCAWYVAARVDQDDIRPIYEEMLDNAGIDHTLLPEGLEKTSRYSDNVRYDFYLNCTAEPLTVENVSGTALLGPAAEGGRLTLPPYGVAVFKIGVRNSV